jgi:RNA polymerase sigma-70 factor (ECF subfamily)
VKHRRGKGSTGSPGFVSVNSAPTDATAARQRYFRTHVEPEIEVLLRVARTLTGSWADAEDLAQDTLIRAYRSIDTFDGAHPRAWLLTILRRAHLNSLRRRRPDLVGDQSELDSQRPAFGAWVAPSPEEVVTDRVLDEVVDRAVSALDEKFRTVLLLTDVDQLTYAEVGELLGVPVGTVMSRLSQARDRVRTQLRNTPHVRRSR